MDRILLEIKRGFLLLAASCAIVATLSTLIYDIPAPRWVLCFAIAATVFFLISFGSDLMIRNPLMPRSASFALTWFIVGIAGLMYASIEAYSRQSLSTFLRVSLIATGILCLGSLGLLYALATEKVPFKVRLQWVFFISATIFLFVGAGLAYTDNIWANRVLYFLAFLCIFAAGVINYTGSSAPGGAPVAGAVAYPPL
jgi:hypothetical protein